jgi:hypothetical protein
MQTPPLPFRPSPKRRALALRQFNLGAATAMVAPARAGAGS